ncbi:hypothetical protein SEA_PARADIDDLES_81 [Streptomyces phage Paradiddles]|jgi:hypothetical protein|uniref:Uncharacterized protein n=3 Tax=Samistivirus TaxID=2560220 RepID=A0A514U1V9_9CAUD|nr:hypothetical protein FDI36_gp173 [Streptomyces phage NootNoot]YP_009611077.1 hypothetical protein FDI37_gp168 [Streptomyces phage Paradiddles]YP_010103978.1 hypothetical protein KNU71_gp178 [Streptomyces phage Braelyn]UGL63084.1 hypothetical protein SEA_BARTHOLOMUNE_84 [Streptomyces phage Bartholomune]UOW93517.1 hypothetical protein SEA_SQUILLIUM_85 [Streptomyces phage Squillium]WNM72966.1 hypothetical protein SEA_PERSIMMON_84 [Streptomyces phage Persimmon]WNM73348.1 hypothetical protein S
MATLVRIEYIRRDNGGWLAYKKYDDGSEYGGPISRQEVENMIMEMFEDFGGVQMPTDLVKDGDD